MILPEITTKLIGTLKARLLEVISNKGPTSFQLVFKIVIIKLCFVFTHFFLRLYFLCWKSNLL